MEPKTLQDEHKRTFEAVFDTTGQLRLQAHEYPSRKKEQAERPALRERLSVEIIYRIIDYVEEL